MQLSQDELDGLILRRIAGGSSPDFENFKKLSLEAQAIALIALSADARERDFRIRAELAAKGLEKILAALDRADPGQDPAQVELSDGWKIKGLAEAYVELPPLQLLVGGIVSAPSVVMFFGAPKNLKSLLILDMALCLASGKNWLPDRGGKFGFKTNQVPVLWCDFEGGERRMVERISAFGRRRAIPADAPFRLGLNAEPLAGLRGQAAGRAVSASL